MSVVKAIEYMNLTCLYIHQYISGLCLLLDLCIMNYTVNMHIYCHTCQYYITACVCTCYVKSICVLVQEFSSVRWHASTLILSLYIILLSDIIIMATFGHVTLVRLIHVHRMRCAHVKYNNYATHAVTFGTNNNN